MKAMGKIKGVHHIAVKPTADCYEKTVDFYTKLLGLEIVKSWGDEKQPCLMISCGDNTCMEILNGEVSGLPHGPLAHLAFHTDYVDELVDTVRNAGYTITKEPTDLELAGNPVRIAFCMGPTGEEVEFFQEK